MDKENLYNDIIKDVDANTGFTKGSQSYNDYYFPKKEKKDVYIDPKPVDNITDFGKGTYYLTCDGKKVATMEEVMMYNKMYYDNMMNKKTEDYSEKNRIHM